MRLGTCVALELAAGAMLIAGLGVSTVWGLGEARAHWEHEARAAQASRALMAEQLPATAASEAMAIAPRMRTAVPAPGSMVPGTPPAAMEPVGRYPNLFDGVRDDLLLAPLRDARIERVKYNRGGSSISLRVEFDNGTRAAFKPQQTNLQTIPRKELAAFRLDRLLGLSAVPPAIGRTFDLEEILAAVEPESQEFLPRLREEMVADGNGKVVGEVSWWIPVIQPAMVSGFDVESTNGIVTWKRLLTIGKTIPESDRHLVSQVSSMVLFDFLINNPDRWSGANVNMSADGRVLYYMDNTLSFGREPDGHRKCRTYMMRSQKFSRRLVGALRELTEEQVREALAGDLGPFEYLLTDEEIEMMLTRRDFALEYIDGLIAEHGESAVLVFP